MPYFQRGLRLFDPVISLHNFFSHVSLFFHHSILLVISPAYILWKRPYMSTKQWEERQSHWVNCPSFTADGCWQYVNGSVFLCIRMLLGHKCVCVCIWGRFGQWFYFSWLIVNDYKLITAAITSCNFQQFFLTLLNIWACKPLPNNCIFK